MPKRDWTGNSRSAHAVIGARNFTEEEREKHDYYATEPAAVKLLTDVETFSHTVWECACGEGHISKELEKVGYSVFSSDLIDRGFGYTFDFLKIKAPPHFRFRRYHEPALCDGKRVC